MPKSKKKGENSDAYLQTLGPIGTKGLYNLIMLIIMFFAIFNFQFKKKNLFYFGRLLLGNGLSYRHHYNIDKPGTLCTATYFSLVMLAITVFEIFHIVHFDANGTSDACCAATRYRRDLVPTLKDSG